MQYKNFKSQNIILFGHPASGKTFFGKQLAKQTGLIFIDTDRAVELFYKQAFGQNLNCREIFLHLGESGFRQLEKSVIDDLQNVKGAIIALGGGVILDSVNCQKLQKIGQLVYLKSDKETLKRRIFLRKPLPAFLDSIDPEKAFERIYEERQPLYDQMGGVIIQTTGKSRQQILTKLTELLSKHFHKGLILILQFIMFF